jgi:hypothetical protein
MRPLLDEILVDHLNRASPLCAAIGFVHLGGDSR